jgi:hypothetical protein
VVQLLDCDIRTQEVNTWKPLHVFHALRAGLGIMRRIDELHLSTRSTVHADSPSSSNGKASTSAGTT